MRRRGKFSLKTSAAGIGRWIASALLLAATSGVAKAQLPAFNGIDWVTDRGNIVFTASNSAVPLRVGNSNFLATVLKPIVGTPDDTSLANNNPWKGAARSRWPRPADVAALPGGGDEFIDNVNKNDPDNFTDTAGNIVRSNPAMPTIVGNDPQKMAHAYLTGAWLAPQVVSGDPLDYRTGSGGYSFVYDPAQTYTFDYDFVAATHNDFLVNRSTGAATPATTAELQNLPYIDADIYASLENVLKNTNTAKAYYTSGSYNLVGGTNYYYGIELFSPGNGTRIYPGNDPNAIDTAHPNISRTIVRVSYGHRVNVGGADDPADVHTVDANGNIIKAGVEDSRYSRLFFVDLTTSGWVPITPYGKAPSQFRYDGDPRDQIVVTVYSVTPDNVSDTNTFPTYPLVTADAVHFVPQPQEGPAANDGLKQKDITGTNTLFTVSPKGRFLSSAVGTNKYAAQVTDAQPLLYVCREEYYTDPNFVFRLNPALPADTITNPELFDPNAILSVPVFYCLDNKNNNATKVVAGLPVPIITTDKIRWRYVGMADAGTGTVSATPLLANVRCRDNTTRAILYFLTKSSDGTVGHIYALDPLGDREDAGAVYKTTKPYWVYPSYRPLTPAQVAAANVPVEYNDPNFKLYAPAENRVPAPTQPWGTDWNDVGLEGKYVDGDIIPNPAQAGHFTVRTDTRVGFGGVQGAPVVIDDPINPTGAQILIVGNLNGRVYCFDAGGRGDFAYDRLNPTDPALTIAGTTQRYWTWPHLKGDAFHTVYSVPGHLALGSAALPGTNVFLDETSKTAFPSSVSFDPTYTVTANGIAQNPVFMGASDGHLFALGTIHDNFLRIDNTTRKPVYDERRIWVYPNKTTSVADTQKLPEAPSTPAIFAPTSGGGNFLYFTCSGRVYCIPERPNLTKLPQFVPNTAFKWVFPYSVNAPADDPTDSFSIPLESSLNHTAPVLIDQARLVKNGIAYTKDMCYVVDDSGIVYGIDASSTGAGIVVASGQILGASDCSPIATLLTSNYLGNDFGQPDLDTNPTKYFTPTIVLGDKTNGYIWGVSAIPNAANATDDPPVPGTLLLPIQWGKRESGGPRSAAPSLVNGYIVSTSEDGQLRTYGVGTGTDGEGSTLGVGEDQDRGTAADLVSIDLRTLNFYNGSDYSKFLTNPPTATPNPNLTNGAPYKLGGVDPHNGSPANTWPVVVDWGENLYIAGSGVYHAVNQDNPGSPTWVRGRTAPTIRIHLTIRLRGASGTIPSQPIVLPPITVGPHTNGNAWPDDRGVTVADHNNLSIYGIDPNNLDAGGNFANPFGERLVGPNQNVYPYAFTYKLPISPDDMKRFLPGSAGYSITAYAEISQPVLDPQSVQNTRVYDQTSNFLTIGQHDYAGLTPLNGDNTVPSAANPVVPVNPNRGAILGRRRGMFVTNPLAVTVRSYFKQGAGTADMTGSLSNPLPNIIGMGGSGAVIVNPYEVLGNGNRVSDPYARTTTAARKPLYAAIGMTQHGSSETYKGVDDLGNRVSAFYLADRSNLRQGTGTYLKVKLLSKPLHWLGGPSSVLNPLPWDQLPSDAQDSRDYPSISPDNLDLTLASGQDAKNVEVRLTPPEYDTAITDPNLRSDRRTVVPTEFKMTVHVPKYQPANINRGVASWKYADGSNFNFGSGFTDMSGALLGDTVNNPIVGPVKVTTGRPVASGDPAALTRLTFPAAGYLSQMVAEVVEPGSTSGSTNNINGRAGLVAIANRSNRDQDFFNDVNGTEVTSINSAYRALELGLTVPPSVKLRVVEQTIDLGKLPHGVGITDYDPTSGKYRVPFAPNGSNAFQQIIDPTIANPILSPWDNEDALGAFFRPFTLVSESNINLYDIRVAKLLGTPNGNGYSVLNPSQLFSDQTTSSLIAAPFITSATPFSGNIGVVSSFDHLSNNHTKNVFGLPYAEDSLWPLNNPFVTGAGIADAALGGLQTTDAINAGLLGWANGIQPQPTIHKPRVGDNAGVIATVPDTPYDSIDLPNLPLPRVQQPKVALSIPVGTPVGTYTAPIYPYEDNVPLQWQEWLSATKAFGTVGGNYVDISHDGVLNVALNGTPMEVYSDPTFNLKATVREARLTGGTTKGTLGQVDPLLNGPFAGANMLPAAIFRPITPLNGAIGTISLYWATNRQPLAGSPYLTAAGRPTTDSPWTLGFSALAEGPGGWTFWNPGTNANPDGRWWQTAGLFPGYDGAGQPIGVATLFPSTAAEAQTANSPFLAGQRVNRTTRYASPAVTTSQDGQTTYLFWQGSVDKNRTGLVANGATQTTDVRTFYTQVDKASPAQPATNSPVLSFLNDPALAKQAPKPLYVVSPTGTFLYLFWHSGGGSKTSIYYNVNGTANFPQSGWTADTKLDTPGSLSWESDANPVYHRTSVPDPTNPGSYRVIDVIDVVYTGTLKNRSAVETLMSRYEVNQNGTLTLISLPQVVGETLTRVGTSNTYTARDAGWVYGSGPGGSFDPAKDTESRIKVYISQNGANSVPLNGTTAGGTDFFKPGTFDPASGLVFFDSALGGQMAVDSRSGTVTFPQVQPKRNDTIFVTYAPQVMRLNTSRDETGIVRTSGYGAFNQYDPAFVARPAITSAGSNRNPVAILDRTVNERAELAAPAVVFNAGGGVDNLATRRTTYFPRLWTLYRKTDASGTVKSGIYYKAMRLMVRLPRAVGLTVPAQQGGDQQIANLKVTGNAGAYEVDWVRGRVYFTEVDEGKPITVQYVTAQGGLSGVLNYRVAWGDEISATAQPSDAGNPYVDHTTPETIMPTDSVVNEGQVTAFQIPSQYRLSSQGPELWVFWTSSRAGTSDLFYQTIRPRLYPTSSNQR